MPRTNRRQFLKTAAAGAVTASSLHLPRALARTTVPTPDFPPHKPLLVPGVFLYSDAESVAPGDTLSLHLSNSVSCRVQIVRLGTDIDSPASDTVVHEFPASAPSVQPIHPGSYVHINQPLTGRLPALTIECWVRPWSLDHLAGLVTQEDKQSDDGFALGIGKDGYVGLFLGNGTGPDEAVVHRTATGVLRKGCWHHVVGRWDGRIKQVWVDGIRIAEWSFTGPLSQGTHPLRLGAMGENGESLRFLDGDLAQCAIYGRALTDAEILRRFTERGLVTDTGDAVLGTWRFAEERGDLVRDASRHRRHGRIVNHATWMIGGPSFHSEVPRFGPGYQPASDPTRGHGLRFASDDLYDCRWRPTHQWKVPAATRPGVYVSRVSYELDGRSRLAHATFIVRRARRSRPAPILVLCSTNTWRAYNGAPFGKWPDSLLAAIGTDGLPNSPGDPPAFCLYRGHAAGQGTYQVGRRMPWPAGSPYALYGGPTRYSHLLRAERFLQAWLENSGYRFDLATDVDLHRNPGLLRDYRCVVLNGHSEYWSIPALQGLETYLKRGGNLCVFSGNCLFWRVSFNGDASIMECRKVDAPGDQLPPSRRGECWHSHDGLRGGLLRDCGFPGWRLVGLETLGWNNQSNPKNFGPYVVSNADHFLFRSPHPTGLRNGDRFGHAPDGGVPLANGHEFDVRLSTLAALQEVPSPNGAQVPADPAGMTPLANGIIPWKEGGSAFDFFFRPIHPKADQGGEMVYWERPDGGRVFHAGSIGSGWALHTDARFQTLVKNVLHHFGVPAPG